MAVSLLWAVVAPVYARGLALIGRALMPVLEAAPDTQYVVQGGRLLASRTGIGATARTVSDAFAVLFDGLTVTLLFFTPAVVPVTLTQKVHDSCGLSSGH